MKSDFFYSPSTGIYMALGPLKIDSRVKKAAEDSKLILDWDDEGRINNIDFDDAKKLLKCLGSFMLTPVEYWKVMNDAKKFGIVFCGGSETSRVEKYGYGTREKKEILYDQILTTFKEFN